MSTTPTVLEVDCSTGVAVQRDMTADELAAQQAAAAAYAAQQAAEQAAAAAAAQAKADAITKLEALGLTVADIQAIVG